MEVDEIHTQPCKISRIGKGRNDSNKIGQYQDEDEDGESRGGSGGGIEADRLSSWSGSRIYRVSRASGGKDRHSKVVTAKGLRDRRVRLSVSTAIQFYDLQDRLGYDQPSKAVEWLIKAAADDIAKLPSLNTTFPDTPKQPSGEKRFRASQQVFDPAEMELDADPSCQHQQQHISLTKSAGSSTSETSKGSGFSLSRSENLVKARERARKRTAKKKEKEKENDETRMDPNSHNSSFTELLRSGGGANENCNSPTESTQTNGPNFVLKPTRHLPSAQMDYFGPGLFGLASSRTNYSSGFSGQSQFGNHTMSMPSAFTVTGDHHHHQELQQFSFLPDHLIPVPTAVGSDYNLNFTISSGLSGVNRGTLQSNSPSPLPHHLPRFPSPVDGANLPFFIGAAASAASSVDNHQFPAGFDGRLQLCYGDGCRHSDLKGKGKN